MTRLLTGRGRARVREFVSDWWSGKQRREPTDTERALIEEALVHYLAAESMLATSAREVAREATTQLTSLYPNPDDPAAASVRDALADLSLRLDNQEDDNLIMREHLVMLSEQIRQLRQAARDPSLEK